MTEQKSISEFEQEAERAQEEAPTDRLLLISSLAKRQMTLERQLEELDQLKKDVSRKLLQVAQVDLPSAMEEVGMVSLELQDGSRVEIQEGVDASIRKDNVPEAHRWLDEHGFGDLINREVKAALPRDQPDLIHQVKEFLETHEVPFDERESVHASRLKRFVREQLERGVDFPEKLFGVFNYRKSKITPPG